MRTKQSARPNVERGQILVLVAGGMIGLIALVALVLEGGTMILNRRDGQNSADVSAVAGTRIVALRYTDVSNTYVRSDVYDAVEASLLVNNCVAGVGTPCLWSGYFVGNPGTGLVDVAPLTDTSDPLPTGATGVRVAVSRQPGTYIGRILGFQSWTVTTEATAVASKPTTMPPGILLPIALCGWEHPTNPDKCGQATGPAPGNSYAFDEGQLVDLTDGKDAPGGFGWISWTGDPSAPVLQQSMCTPNNLQFSLDDPYDDPGTPLPLYGTHPGDGETWFPEDNGKSNKTQVRACLDAWIDAGIERGTQVLVPIYDIIVKSPPLKPQYHFTGVASVVLMSRDQPAVDNIQATFVKYYPFLDVPANVGTQPPAPGDRAVFIGLVR